MKFQWAVQFEDEIVYQFDSDNNEVMYSEVENRLDEASFFFITDIKREAFVAIDLKKKEIFYLGKQQKMYLKHNDSKFFFRRRNRLQHELIGTELRLIDSETFHQLGFKHKDGREEFISLWSVNNIPQYMVEIYPN